MFGKRQRGALFAAVFVALVSAVSHAGERPKNLVVMIADGTGSQQYTFARWWKGDALNIEKYRTGTLRTFSADSVVTDSAAAATAFATGVRTNGGFIGIGPASKKKLLPGAAPYNGVDYHPLATVLEGARLLGKATGIVATSRFSHATPAAYFAHTTHRNYENDIAEMGVYANIDVVLAGGLRCLRPRDKKGTRDDDEDLTRVLRDRGYALALTAEEMRAVTSGRLWGGFASSHMEPDMDRRDTGPEQPTLAEMTGKALELLSRNEHGFFLMVEGSQVDWANHANDPAYMATELVAWDEACDQAIRFAQKNGETLVLMLSDHDTGGFTIGNRRSDDTYSHMTIDQLLEPVRKARMSSRRMASRLGKSPSVADVAKIVKQGWDVDIAESEARRLLELAAYYSDDRDWAFGEVLSATQTFVGWSTHGHVGGDVPIGAYGPGKPEGVYDSPGFGAFCAGILGLDMANATQRLFVDAEKAFGAEAVSLVVKKIPDKKGGETPVEYMLTVKHKGRNAAFFANKNSMELDGETIEMEGVAFCNRDTRKFYIPAQGVALVTGDTGALVEIRK